MNSQLILGVVGDDFTGSSDAASFIVKSGLKTMLFDGIPTAASLEKHQVQAAVIALKSRMAPVDVAVSESLKAANWLKEKGALHLFSKYCSTFDSTPKGNIGPILDGFLENFNAKSSIICPALPVNGRIVKDGILYINGVPLSESPMKHHPLTPMWDSSLKNLMEAQSKYACFNISRKLLHDNNKLQSFVSSHEEKCDHCYFIPDYVDDNDASRIADFFGANRVLSGGSGILTALGKRYLQDVSASKAQLPPSKTSGKAFLIAGSCSVATLRQIKNYENLYKNTIKINADALMAGKIDDEKLWDEYEQKSLTAPALIYSSANADEVKALQNKYGVTPLALTIENLMTKLTVRAFKSGYTRYIVAGGETSGAVMRGLPSDGYLIGESVAPGVPVMTPSCNELLRLVLKSGNFGDDQFFAKAVQFTGA